MKPQSYKNHTRFYTPHHFVFYPLVAILLGISIFFVFYYEEQRVIWIFITILIGLITWVSYMLRQHYALTLQNRIIRLELRYRYFTLTNERLELLEHKLSDAQIFALRFASDEELPLLVKSAAADKITPGAIKRGIKRWKPDHNRV